MIPCVGILDSGLGGLSVLQEIHSLLPNQKLLYVADSAWCPYGPKPVPDIQKRVFAISDFLVSQGAQCIVVACNSATISAIGALREHFSLPFIGMEPGVKPAVQNTKTGVIGVLATEASLAGEKFQHLVDQYAKKTKVITRPCPRFVDLVENGDLDSDFARNVIEEEIQPLLDAGADTLVLGCTHYPFLQPLIVKFVKKRATIIDTGAAVARQLEVVSQNIPTLQNLKDSPEIICYSTGFNKFLPDRIKSLVPNLIISVKPLDL